MSEILSYKDIIYNILQWIPDGTTYKIATLVCSLWHQICREELRWMIAKYSNHLWTLIDKLPDKPWYWSGISGNPNTTWDIIGSRTTYTCLRENWDWRWISSNNNINMD